MPGSGIYADCRPRQESKGVGGLKPVWNRVRHPPAQTHHRARPTEVSRFNIPGIPIKPCITLFTKQPPAKAGGFE